VSRSASLFLSHERISSIFVSTKSARRRFSLGSTGGFLVSKLVKPTKVFCSWASYETGFSRLRFPEAKPNIRAVAAGVLREANSTVSQEVAGLDSSNRVFCQLAELAPLFVSDRSAQILDLNQSLADEDGLSDLRDSRHPGVAKELRI
jgi:hypothetical protein